VIVLPALTIRFCKQAQPGFTHQYHGNDSRSVSSGFEHRLPGWLRKQWAGAKRLSLYMRGICRPASSIWGQMTLKLFSNR